MEKIKLTKEQANAIENYERSQSTSLLFYLKNKPFRHEYRGLNDLTVDDVAQALYIGYEVEPEFKAKDWVTNKVTGIVNQVNMLRDGDIIQTHDMNYVLDVWYLNDTRHSTPEEIATEKQRRWWKKRDRGVWELFCKDLLATPTGRIYRVISTDGPHADYVIKNDDGQVEFIMKKTPSNDSYFKVICFAKDRHDLGGN